MVPKFVDIKNILNYYTPIYIHQILLNGRKSMNERERK